MSTPVPELGTWMQHESANRAVPSSRFRVPGWNGVPNLPGTRNIEPGTLITIDEEAGFEIRVIAIGRKFCQIETK